MLIKDRNLGVGHFLGEIARIGARFGVVARKTRGDHRVFLEIRETRRTGHDKGLRNFFAGEIFRDGQIARRAERREHKGDFVAFHQLAGLFDRLRRTVGIVERDQVDLASVDAAPVIDGADIGDQRLADCAQRRGRAAEWKHRADLDFGCGHAGRIVCHDG